MKISRRQALLGSAALLTPASSAKAQLLLSNGGIALSGGSLAQAPPPVAPPTYNMNLALTPPALPYALVVANGTWVTATDSSSNVYLYSSTTGGFPVAFVSASPGPNTCSATFVVGHTASTRPSRSICYPGLCVTTAGGSYQFILCLGTTDTYAVGIQKQPNGGGTAALLTSLGTPGGTLSAALKYTCTCTATYATGTTTVTMAVQRSSDNNWLTSSNTWSATQQNALSYADNSSPFLASGAVTLNIYQTAVDVAIYAVSVPNCQVPFTQHSGGVNPVITKGATYDGIQADALAAPTQCYDGTRYVMAVNFWNIASSKWYLGFFTSPDMATWTYVTGSLLSPKSGNYLIGNGGLCFWGGKYWMDIENQTTSGGSTTVDIYSSSSTSLLSSSWTISPTDIVSGGFDVSIDVNSAGNGLEVWYNIGSDGSRTFNLITSPDGVTWTNQGAYFTNPIGYGSTPLHNLGTPSIWYQGATRYLTFDGAPVATGYRYTAMAHSPGQLTNDWVFDGYVNFPNPNYVWQEGEVFDMSVILADLGDGNGVIARANWAGSDTNSATDNTDSSIGLASLIP